MKLDNPIVTIHTEPRATAFVMVGCTGSSVKVRRCPRNCEQERNLLSVTAT